MLRNIENNIKLNFISYVRRFINSSFRKQNNNILENCEKFRRVLRTNKRYPLEKYIHLIISPVR